MANATWQCKAQPKCSRLRQAGLRQGVGSHAAHLLLRSGVGRLRLIDFDQVTLSSLNRHATATRQDVGLPKATCLQVPRSAPGALGSQSLVPNLYAVTPSGMSKLPQYLCFGCKALT